MFEYDLAETLLEQEHLHTICEQGFLLFLLLLSGSAFEVLLVVQVLLSASSFAFVCVDLHWSFLSKGHTFITTFSFLLSFFVFFSTPSISFSKNEIGEVATSLFSTTEQVCSQLASISGFSITTAGLNKSRNLSKRYKLNKNNLNNL